MRTRGLVIVALAAMGCGGHASHEDAPAAPSVEAPAIPVPVAIASTPWLVTVDEPPAVRGGPMRASRMANGALESVLLEPSAESALWSPDGNSIAYFVVDPSGATSLWALHLDGDQWGAPQLLSALRTTFAQRSWSPTGTALVTTEGGRTSVTTLDGGVFRTTVIMDGGADYEPWPTWSPRGDSFVLPSGKTLSFYDVGAGTLKPIAMPAAAGSGSYAVDIRPDAFSPDGRWFWLTVFVTTDPSGPPTREYVYATDGATEPRVVPACADVSSSCSELAWASDSASVRFAERPISGGVGAGTFRAWFPADGHEVDLATEEFDPWFGDLFVSQGPPFGPLVVLDLRDPAHPAKATVPTTDASTFRSNRVAMAPDQSSVALLHQSGTESWIELVDLRGTAPWPHRELYRDAGDFLPVWTENGRFLVAQRGLYSVSRTHRDTVIDPATGAVSDIDVELGPVPSTFVYSAPARVSDAGFVASPGTDALAIVPLGTPTMNGVSLSNIPRWTTVLWRPTR